MDAYFIKRFQYLKIFIIQIYIFNTKIIGKILLIQYQLLLHDRNILKVDIFEVILFFRKTIQTAYKKTVC